MAKSWDKFEDRVRDLASHLWGLPCQPRNLGGVNIDGVIDRDAELKILIEITEERSLDKVRRDVNKLITAKSAAFAGGVLAKCYCVIEGSVTNSMRQAGEAHHIKVVSFDEFSRLFFDFDRYRTARDRQAFGSAIDPLTGAIDNTEYVPVQYVRDDNEREATSADIAKWLQDGKNVILLGEYGSGKSRCIREVFRILSGTAYKTFCFPVAINLRETWGLKRGVELLNRHFADLGLGDIEPACIRAYRSGSLALLLDGFDEVGSQAWSNDGEKLRVIRMRSLAGVKEIISNNGGGSLIAGREHYFPNNNEMYAALGLTQRDTIIVRCKNEFSDTELLEYFQKRDVDVDLPSWLPRRPLICQTIGLLEPSSLNQMFGEQGNEVEFWSHFIKVVCERDARIHESFDPDTIYTMFVKLARLTRSKSANVGPISLSELQAAFEAATGSAPIEEAALMLQRLPTLGRVGAESSERQFVDTYILDGLRAKDVASIALASEAELGALEGAVWQNPLDELGQRILAADNSSTLKHRISLAQRFSRSMNKVLASDLCVSGLHAGQEIVDFDGTVIENGEFLSFPLHLVPITNLEIRNSYFGELAFPVKSAENCAFTNCMTPKVAGIASAAGLPQWIKGLDAEQFDSVESISRIRRIGLDPAHEILTTIIRKTFFQKGAGRKEEALLRGLGMVGTKALARKILNLMIKEGLLTTFKGDEGAVYAPVRSHAERMQSILDKLKSSTDPLWVAVSEL